MFMVQNYDILKCKTININQKDIKILVLIAF